jgi:hypothetical protein
MKFEENKIMSISNENYIELAKTIKTFDEAIRVAIRAWGRAEKQIYLELGIDRGNFSRMLSGEANFPPRFLPKLCQIIGNDFILAWLAYQQGYELRIIPKILENQLEKERAEKEAALQKITYLEELLIKKGE